MCKQALRSSRGQDNHSKEIVHFPVTQHSHSILSISAAAACSNASILNPDPRGLYPLVSSPIHQQ